MTFKTTQLRDAITFALAVGSTALIGTGAAYAQNAEKEATTLDRVEVTGSRIKRADIETSQPVFSMSRVQIEQQGLTSVGDILQNISTNGSALNSTYNNGGNGETRVDLRNLGSDRTLVLVNGRRWVGGTGLGGAVDLNTIPTAAVERIEVLKDGASTIYGSDAIAGVVNIILRRNFDGAEANAYIGQFDKGDGSRQSYDFTIGSTSDRWSAMLGVGYVKEEPIWAGDRKISAVPVYGAVPGTGNSPNTPDGRFAYFGPIPGGSGQTRLDGTPGYFVPNGQPGGRPYTAADAFNHAPLNYLLTPQERTSVFGDATLNITDKVSFRTTVTYNERKSQQILAPMPVSLGRSAAGTNAADIVISKDNAYNNTGRDIDYIQRRFVETGGRIYNQNVKTYAFNGVFEGSFDVGTRNFSWEAGMFYGKNDQTDTTSGFQNVSALRNALGPSFVDGSGQLRCGANGNAIDRCVPLNLLGGAGTITREMLDYVGFEAHDVYGYEQKTYYANIGGDLFDLPGGAMAFSFGLEHRSESGFDHPDGLINSGDTTGNARTATQGGYDLDEAYLELAIPLLADVPGAKLLDFSLATRYSDYSNFGDTLNSKFGFRWKPIDDLLIRGNWSEGFRAPSISELFSGVSDTFEDVADPCAGFLPPGNVPNPNRPAGCTGTPYVQSASQIRTTVGGNTKLGPEKSKSKTLGFVYSPGWAPGLDIALDWWNVKIEDAIFTQTAQEMLDTCYRQGNSAVCGLIQRDSATGEIVNMLAVPNNVGEIEVEGYDLTVGYRLPEFSWGKVAVNWDSTYMTDYTVTDPITTGKNRVGEYRGGSARDNYFRLRSNLSVNWELGSVGATANLRYYSSQTENCTGANLANPVNIPLLCSDPNRVTSAGKDPENHIPSVTYTDLSAYVQVPWNAKVTVGVNNVFDRDPPGSATTFANSFDPAFEVPGRFYYMRYTQRF
ncbi:TonB-dependent receptor [Lysobacter enzymogenes]|uniref:TonB-dependent receptor n=1 Tax=Lysobacter enzymogenes TaxID=69 RepID=A0A188XLR0_LYSEN|nr:TonB-dependent receptor [Lysobacter enzymogenes]ALH06617.1 TonB-dependent receptor [Lysobacter enzymogenes]ROU04717.1 TonB-dependent receptor [Lysobacter enzymogenes]